MNINIDGLNIKYTDEGSGQVVLLLHGWNSSYTVYSGIINLLKNRYRVVALNFPGCDGSDTMETPWTLDDYCNFVLKFMTALNITDPIMFGHSHGGRVTLKMAATGMVNPPKIVLLDSAGLIPKKSFKQKFRAKSFKVIKWFLTLPIIKSFSAGLLDKARAYYGSADIMPRPKYCAKLWLVWLTPICVILSVISQPPPCSFGAKTILQHL